jgi:colanic acid/amylovoran biosynthesis glycosyltransferase
VLATQHSGIPELIQNGVSGLLLKERDAEGIAGALERIAAGEIDIALMRREARHAVEMQFNNVALDRDLVEICSDLVQGQLGASALQRDHGSLSSMKGG